MNTNPLSKFTLSGDFYGDNAISQSLQKLLCVRPHEIRAKKTIILTTDSQSWNVEKIGNSSTIIDLSTLIGIKNEETLSGVKLSNKVVKEFLLAGWSRRAIFSEYRLDLKVRQFIDIAIFEPENIWQIAVKVVTNNKSLSIAEQEIKDYRTTAKWLCVTNGIEFKLFNKETNESRLLDHAPSLNELGIQEGETNPQKSGQRSLRILNPSSIKTLLTEVEKTQPESIVTDFIVPWLFQMTKGSQLDAILSQFINTLPVSIREQMRGSIHILPVILAWAATIPSVKTISAIVPAGFVTDHWAHQWFRKCFGERLRLCCVLDLPRDLFPFTVTTSSLLYFGGEREQTYFDVLASRGDLISMNSRPWFDSLLKWMKGDKPSTGYTTKIENNSNWAVKANDPEIEKTLERLARVGGLESLSELCDIKPGFLSDRQVSEGNTPLINPRDFRGDYVDFENATKIEASSLPEEEWLKNGDLLVSSISANFFVVLNRSSQPAVPGKYVIVLRPKNDRVSSEYLLEYLNSSTAKKLIAARILMAHGIQHISIQSLHELPVPVVDPKLSQGLTDIQHIEIKLRAKAEELKSLRRALFDAPDYPSFQGSLIELKRSGTLLQTSLQYVDRLEFQIANFYPFPIAYGFRLLESNVHPTQLYKEQLRVAENLLAFLGSISLALLQQQDRQNPNLNLQKYWQGGISPGHWKDIIGHTGKNFAAYKDDPLTGHLHRLNIFQTKKEKSFGSDVSALYTAKNDFKHDRGPTVEKDVFQATQDTQERLRRCMEALAFFTEYPIRQVVDVNPSRRGSEVTLICLPFIGDHPGFTPERIISNKALHKGDLFIDAGRQEWVPLYPFITATACSKCKTKETYFIDKCDNGTAQIKSFERGHTETCDEIAEELADWGSNE